MANNPLHSTSDRSCPACDSTSLTSGTLTGGRFSSPGRERVDLFACDACGEFWFERAGLPLTAEALRDLGLNS